MTPRKQFAWLLSLAAFAGCASAAKPAALGHQGTPLAVNADPKLIEMTVEPTASLLAAARTSELGLRVRITAGTLPDARRPPLNLALVLDTSGSMEGDAIGALKSGAKELVRKLRDGDQLSIIGFHSRVDVLVDNSVIAGGNRERMLHAIDGIVARGTTDLANGLNAGLEHLMRRPLPKGINRIVLFSDGVPNASAALPAMLQTIHQRGISVTSLGFGIDYDTTLMTQIARDTGGTFHYLEKPEAVAAVFDNELTKMTTVVGRNLQLALESGPGVVIQPMPGLVAGGDGKFYAAIGDLPAGESRDLMIPIQVTARADGTTAELVQATLSFEDVIGNSGPRTREAFVGVRASSDTAAVKGSIKIGLEVARVRAMAAAHILQAIMMARQGQVAPARALLSKAITEVKAAAAKLGDDDLTKLLQELEDVSNQLAQIVVAPPTLIGGADNERKPSTAPAAVEPALRRAEEAASATVQGRGR